MSDSIFVYGHTSSAAEARRRLNAIAVDGARETVWKRGFEGIPGYEICTFVYRSGIGPVPEGRTRLDLVSAVGIAVVNVGASGTTHTVALSYPLTIPEDTATLLTAWDTSAQAALGSPVVGTRSGNQFTLESARSMFPGDFFYDVSQCELELGVDWVPGGAAGISYFTGSGLRGYWQTSEGFVKLPGLFPGGIASTPQFLALFAKLDTDTVSGGASSWVGFGYSSDGGSEVVAAGIYNDAGTWKRGVGLNRAEGALAAGWIQNTAIGTPGSKDGAVFGFFSAPSAASQIQYQATADHPDWTDGINFGSTGSSEIQWGQGADGPPEEFFFSGLATSGVVDVTITEIGIIWA